MQDKGIKIESAEVGYVAKQTKQLTETGQEKINKLIDDLEENEDVADITHNIEHITHNKN